MGGLLVAVAVLIITCGIGCQNHSRPAIEDQTAVADEPTGRPVELSDTQEAEALAAMRAVAGDGPPTQRPERGPKRGRWSDVPAAARAAAAQHEMAIVKSRTTQLGWVFELRCVGDRPATLRVERRPGVAVYEAFASVGLFGDDSDAANELLASFDKSMQAHGRKRKYPQASD